MDYLRLLVALSLPWLGGYLWLSVLEYRLGPGERGAWSRIGYGLFLGYAGVQGIVLVSGALSEQLHFWPLLTVMTLVTACGGALLALTRTQSAEKRASEKLIILSPIVSRALLWICLTWSCLHLLMAAIEILHRPVFPWDGWFNWMYRAKAWYYQGQVIPLDLPGDWLRGNINALYNVDGNHYPTFSSILALWSAMALGHWSETLVNLPVLFCGIALGLGLYGQCREFGMPGWLSVLCAYLLLSIPLVGTHLSLAGQADIWMAGFTGLGFVALLNGTITGVRFHVILGLGMIALGMATKLEGTVWFLSALMTFALARYTKIAVYGLTVFAVIAIGGWLTGVTNVDLPLLGNAGFIEGRVHIPLLGSYAINTFELGNAYQENFFKNGTWHLLWTFVLLSLVGLCFIGAGILRRTILSFYTVLLAAQLFIFQGTESGQWAADWTAINRLPLHFVPPLIFSLGALVANFLSRESTTRPIRNPLQAMAAGLLIVAAATLAYLMAGYPATDGSPQRFTASDMRIVVGGGRLAGDVGLVEQYQDNIAILSSGPVQLDARKVSALRLNTQGENQGPRKFFWRTGASPEDLHYTEIAGRGVILLNLGDIPQWQGQVNELGMIFYSDGGTAAEFHGLEIKPDSWAWQLRKLTRDWTETSLWTQRAVNWLPAGATSTAVPLPILMASWVIITLLVTLVITRNRQSVLTTGLLCAIAAWGVLDLRWTVNGAAQAANTLRTYPFLTATSLDFGDDSFTRGLVEAARKDLGNSTGRTIMMAEDETMRFQLLRAKYHALPAAAYAHYGSAQNIPREIADHILFLRKRYAQPELARLTPEDFVKAIGKNAGIQATVVWDKPDGFLLSVTTVK